jgi:hypothetical protein
MFSAFVVVQSWMLMFIYGVFDVEGVKPVCFVKIKS